MQTISKHIVPNGSGYLDTDPLENAIISKMSKKTLLATLFIHNMIMELV